jgi:spectrin alpha
VPAATIAGLLAQQKKHTAFEGEVSAHIGALDNLRTDGHELIGQQHFASDLLQAKVADTTSQWTALKEEVRQKAIVLEQTHALVHYKREANELLSWIDDKNKIAGAEDLGADVETCEVLQKKFEDFNNDIAANEPRLETLNGKTAQLTAEQHPSAAVIQEQQAGVVTAWEALRLLGATRAKKLADAHEVHVFNRNVDETNGRIADKKKLLAAVEETPRDVAGIELQKRKHEGFARDLAALEESVKALDAEAKRLTGLYPGAAAGVTTAAGQLKQAMSTLASDSAHRNASLGNSREYQQFLDDHHYAMSWITDMTKTIHGEVLASDVSGADSLLHRHTERRSEIEARQPSFQAVTAFGKELLAQSHPSSATVQGKSAELQAAVAGLDALWQARQVDFARSQEERVLQRDAEQMNAWVANKEALLAAEPIGDSPESVEALLKKHDDFKKSVDAQEEKKRALGETAQKMIASRVADTASTVVPPVRFRVCMIANFFITHTTDRLFRPRSQLSR